MKKKKANDVERREGTVVLEEFRVQWRHWRVNQVTLLCLCITKHFLGDLWRH